MKATPINTVKTLNIFTATLGEKLQLGDVVFLVVHIVKNKNGKDHNGPAKKKTMHLAWLTHERP